MFYPVFLDLRHRHVLVVGGGTVAERKVHSLVEAEATITIVSPEITKGIRDLAARQVIRMFTRNFIDSDLDGIGIVISATDDPSVQKHVATAARARNVWINTVDQPDLCDFIVPA